MWELISNAWMGWLEYISHGKLAAVLLAVLLFLWFGRSAWRQRSFVLYATVMTIVCICPLTAAVLMGYQTRFFNYRWIWSAVPLTGLCAYGIVMFLSWLLGRREESGQGASKARGMGLEKARKGRRYEAVVLTAFLLAILFLAGGLGSGEWNSTGLREEREKAYRVVAQLREQWDGQTADTICLWAPRELLEYAREADAEITLLYGRNMWDLALNGYAYDVYDERTVNLYEFMDALREPEFGFKWLLEDKLKEHGAEVKWEVGDLGQTLFTGAEVQRLVEEYAEAAREAGVNCLVLPAVTPKEIAYKMAEVFGTTPKSLEEYWVIYE